MEIHINPATWKLVIEDGTPMKPCKAEDCPENLYHPHNALHCQHRKEHPYSKSCNMTCKNNPPCEAKNA